MDGENEKKQYSIKEELANSITHGLGVVFGIVVLSILLYMSIQKGDIKSIVGFSIYGGSLILMYLASTLYHSVTIDKIKSVLRVFDHCSIFLFIAGTYTPVAILTLSGSMRVITLIVMWTIALGGVIFKIATFNKFDKYKLISLILYIGMGWITVFSLKSIIQETSIRFIMWLAAGGIVYTLGTIFYSNKKIPYNHAIWHLFVLGGTVFHFIGIYKYLA